MDFMQKLEFIKIPKIQTRQLTKIQNYLEANEPLFYKKLKISFTPNINWINNNQYTALALTVKGHLTKDIANKLSEYINTDISNRITTNNNFFDGLHDYFITLTNAEILTLYNNSVLKNDTPITINQLLYSNPTFSYNQQLYPNISLPNKYFHLYQILYSRLPALFYINNNHIYLNINESQNTANIYITQRYQKYLTKMQKILDLPKPSHYYSEYTWNNPLNIIQYHITIDQLTNIAAYLKILMT